MKQSSYKPPKFIKPCIAERPVFMPKKRKAHVITQLKKAVRPDKIIFFDCETTSKDIDEFTVEPQFCFLCASYINFKNGEKEENFTTDSLVKFWKWVNSKVNAGESLLLIAHNTDFDFNICKGFTYLHKAGYFLHLYTPDAGRFIHRWCTSPPPKFLDENGVEIPKEKHHQTIIVLDSMNYFKRSLDSIGQLMGLNKFPFPVEIKYNKECIEYCHQDVLILKTLILNYINWLDKNNFGPFALTLPSQTFKTFRYRFMTHKIYIHNDETAIDLEREAFQGGRVSCYRIGKQKKQKYYKLDVNGMYVYLMSHYNYPTKLVCCQGVMRQDLFEYHYKKYGIIAKVEYDTPTDCVPIHYKSRLNFPIGQGIAWLCKPELELLLEMGGTFKPLQFVSYELNPIFKKYMKYLTDLREYYKKEKNVLYDQLTKLLGVSVFGKFGQKQEVWKPIGQHFNQESWYESISNDRDNTIDVFKCIKGTIYKRIGLIEGNDTLVAIPAYVASYARAMLFRFMVLAKRENVFYNDTDSLFTNEAGMINLKPHIHLYELGKLAIEEISTNFIIHNPKDYVFGDEAKIKGVKRGAKELEPNIFEMFKWERTAGLIHDNRVETMRIIKYNKHLTRMYKKGIVLKSGEVRPFKLGMEDFRDESQIGKYQKRESGID